MELDEFLSLFPFVVRKQLHNAITGAQIPGGFYYEAECLACKGRMQIFSTVRWTKGTKEITWLSYCLSESCLGGGTDRILELVGVQKSELRRKLNIFFSLFTCSFILFFLIA